VRWRLGDSFGEVPERVSGAEYAYHCEGQAADQQHALAHSSPLPIDIHDMTLCGEGPEVSRRDSVAISLSCEWRRPWSNRPHVRLPYSRALPSLTGRAAGVGPGERYLRPITPILQLVTIEYPPPDPDGRHSIRIDFNLGGDLPELDLGTGGASIGSIREQQLELSEGLQVVLFEDEGDEWMLVDAIVDRFNPQRDGSWIVRLDWSTFRRMPKPGR